VIHIIGGAVMLQAALTGTDAFVRAQVGSSPVALPPLGAQGAALSVAGGVFAFHAFNLTWLGLTVLCVAILLNWRNVPAGYWLNLAIVGFTDLGLVLFIVTPGIMPWSDAWIGPVLFVPAWLFSTMGMRWRTGGVSADALRPAGA
jgi:hypothetical protein